MTNRTRTRSLLGASIAAALVLAACGDDDDDASDTTEAAAETTATTDAMSEDDADTTATTEAMSEDTADADDGDASGARIIVGQPDVNGDGTIIVGLLSAGDTTDGGYFQSLVDETEAFVAEQGDGWEVINVDNVTATDAVQQMENLLAQGVDIFALGGGDLLYPQLREVAARPEYENVAFVVTGAQDRTPDANVTSMTDNNDDISFSAGVSAGLALEERGETTAGIIGFDGSDPFIVATNAMEAGLKYVNPDFELVVSTVGPQPRRRRRIDRGGSADDSPKASVRSIRSSAPARTR